MKITEKLLRPITEISYLTADNVKRYRCIMRFFYLQYERINYWINQEEVFAELNFCGMFGGAAKSGGIVAAGYVGCGRADIRNGC